MFSLKYTFINVKRVERTYRILLLLYLGPLGHVAPMRHILHRLLVGNSHPLLGRRRHCVAAAAARTQALKQPGSSYQIKKIYNHQFVVYKKSVTRAEP